MARPRLVVVESPFSARTVETLERHAHYLNCALKDCFIRNEAPFASHGLYTRPNVLDDTNLDDRETGMEAGFAWGRYADLVAIYVDLGVTDGMKSGIRIAEDRGITVEYRKIIPSQQSLMTGTFDQYTRLYLKGRR